MLTSLCHILWHRPNGKLCNVSAEGFWFCTGRNLPFPIGMMLTMWYKRWLDANWSTMNHQHLLLLLPSCWMKTNHEHECKKLCDVLRSQHRNQSKLLTTAERQNSHRLMNWSTWRVLQMLQFRQINWSTKHDSSIKQTVQVTRGHVVVYIFHTRECNLTGGHRYWRVVTKLWQLIAVML